MNMQKSNKKKENRITDNRNTRQVGLSSNNELLLRIRKIKPLLIVSLIFFLILFSISTRDVIYASGTPIDGGNTQGVDFEGNLGPINFQLDNGEEGGLSTTLQIMLLVTIIALAPSILIMVTSFTRILVVLHFVRSALGTQTTPPNQVLIGIAIFLTVFIMSPIFTDINETAIKPLENGEITQEVALEEGVKPLRTFMLEQTNQKDLQLFLDIAEIGEVSEVDDIPTSVIIPAFIISELKIAFIIGFLIYIPFLIIDMVVASTLMSMGMMMLPPTTISMPFKILLFIMADGWNLVLGELVKTFY